MPQIKVEKFLSPEQRQKDEEKGKEEDKRRLEAKVWGSLPIISFGYTDLLSSNLKNFLVDSGNGSNMVQIIIIIIIIIISQVTSPMVLSTERHFSIC